MSWPNVRGSVWPGGVRISFFIQGFFLDLLDGFIAILVVALIGNLVLGNFKLGFAGHPLPTATALELSRHDAGRSLLCSMGGLSPAAARIGGMRGNTDSAVALYLAFIGRSFFSPTISVWLRAEWGPGSRPGGSINRFRRYCYFSILFICRANLIAREVRR